MYFKKLIDLVFSNILYTQSLAYQGEFFFTERGQLTKRGNAYIKLSLIL